MVVNEVHKRLRSLPLVVYLNFAILFPTKPFQEGWGRIALLSAFALYVLAFVAHARTLVAPRLRAAAQLAVFEAIPLCVLVYSLTSPNKVRIWEAFVIVVLIAALIGRDWYDGRPARKRGLTAERIGWLLVALAVSVPLLNLASGLLVPKLSDVATTTADAVRLLLQGHNPYAASLDPYGAINAHDPAFGGYKYLPLMIVLHVPFVVAFGAMGTLWANALLVAGLAAAVWALTRGSPQAAGAGIESWMAVAVLLATPELAETALAMGYNDVAGTLLVLAAFLVRGRSLLLAGLLVGCSLSLKLMPGLVAAAILFPPRQWKPYVAGAVIGLLPTALLLAWDPAALIRNILLFNLVRSPDTTSWRLFAPAWLGSAAAAAALLGWLSASAWLAWRSWLGKIPAAFGWDETQLRLAIYVVATLLLVMTGSTAHDDYMIWWMPALLVLMSVRTRLPYPARGDRERQPAMVNRMLEHAPTA